MLSPLMGIPFAFKGVNANHKKMLLFLPSIQNTIRILEKEPAPLTKMWIRTKVKKVESIHEKR
jgi:hypothetical protein